MESVDLEEKDQAEDKVVDVIVSECVICMREISFKSGGRRLFLHVGCHVFS